MANLLPEGKQSFETATGIPLVGGKVYTYDAGTNNPRQTTSDAAGLVPNANPIILDARGEATIFWSGAYKVTLKDSLDNTIWTVDNILSSVASLLDNYSLDAGAVNAYAVNAALATATLVAGLQVAIKINATNTDASTLNYMGLGAKNITASGAPLRGGEMQAPNIYLLEYDGINFELLNPAVPPSLARTPAERAAGVMPVNFSYLPMHVDRYFTNTGVNDAALAFNAAFAVAKISGGMIRYGATAPYTTLTPINFTSGLADRQYGLTLRNETGPEMANFPPGPSLIGNHNGHVIDLSGTIGMVFENVAIGVGATSPKTGFFQARILPAGGVGFGGPSCGITRFVNCSTLGAFSAAAYYNYAAEDDQLIGCYFRNDSANPNAKAIQYTGNNIAGLTSTFQTLASGIVQSNLDHKIYGGEVSMHASTATCDAIGLEATDSLKIFGPWVSCSDGANGGRSLIYVDMTNGPSSLVMLDSITGENPGSLASRPTYGLLFSNHVQTPTGWEIRNFRAPTRGNAIATAGTNPTIDNFKIDHISEVTSLGIGFAGTTVQNSVLNLQSTLLTIGTSIKNVLIGDSGQWTITTRSNDNWIDSGSVNKTWIPALGTMTHGGVLTINEAKCLFYGNMCTVTFTMTDTVSITATAAQTITGLPKPSVNRSALVQIANESTGLAIGAGFIETGQSAIKMPAFTVGAGVSVTVSATYFIA